MIVAGFDPSWGKINYAMTMCEYSKTRNKFTLVRYGQQQVQDLGPKDFNNEDLYLSYIAKRHADEIGLILSDLPVVQFAFIEKPLFVQNGETTIKLSIAASALFYRCKAKGIIPEFVTNGTWKKIAIGNGNASKELIAKEAMDMFDLPELKKKEWDIYDAALIAYYGAVQLLIRAKEEESAQ